MCICECVSVYLDSVNITFGFFKIFHFSSCLFSMVFTWSFPFYFPDDLWKKLGKFVITFSPVTLIACFCIVLNIPCSFIIMPSTGSLFTWLSIHLHAILGYKPLSYLIPFIAVSLCSIHPCSLHLFHFHPIILPLSVCPGLAKLVFIFWGKGIGLTITQFTILFSENCQLI